MVPEETEEDEDEVAWALAELDWAMMDELVAHWDRDVTRIVSGFLPQRPRAKAGRQAGRHGKGGR